MLIGQNINAVKVILGAKSNAPILSSSILWMLFNIFFFFENTKSAKNPRPRIVTIFKSTNNGNDAATSPPPIWTTLRVIYEATFFLYKNSENPNTKKNKNKTIKIFV